jgi:hypothetical protein
VGVSTKAPTIRDRQAEASVVLGFLGLLAVPVIPAIAAIVVGLRAKRRIEADPQASGRRWAIAGILLGVLGLLGAVAGVLYIALY